MTRPTAIAPGLRAAQFNLYIAARALARSRARLARVLATLPTRVEVAP